MKKTDHPPARHTSVSSNIEQSQNGKGKEKEDVHSSTSKPTDVPSPKRKKAQSLTPINTKRCKEVMKTIQRVPLADAMIFARPVDPEADGCPTFVDVLQIMELVF
jgi:transcription initiation factor TFIID subunit 2